MQVYRNEVALDVVELEAYREVGEGEVWVLLRLVRGVHTPDGLVGVCRDAVKVDGRGGRDGQRGHHISRRWELSSITQAVIYLEIINTITQLHKLKAINISKQASFSGKKLKQK